MGEDQAESQRRAEEAHRSDEEVGEITRALRGAAATGDGVASVDGPRNNSELLDLVYEQLHAIARRRMSGERSAHTLQATALVHEVYLKLMGDRADGIWRDRGQFFRAAAEAMRRILIDYARRRGSAKRGGGRRPAPLDVVDLATEHDPADVLALDEALATLEREDPRAAEVVRLRFFAGLEVDEVAEVTGLSPRTVAREWAFARARLHQLLGDEETVGER